MNTSTSSISVNNQRFKKYGDKEEIIKFIEKYEGVYTVAYWDAKQWSIGLGTKSYKGEKISKEEAYKRSGQVIDGIIKKYDLHNEPLEVKKAVVSFIYNIGGLSQKQKQLLKNKYYKALGNEFKNYKYCEGKVCGGLVKRRRAEANLLFKF